MIMERTGATSSAGRAMGPAGRSRWTHLRAAPPGVTAAFLTVEALALALIITTMILWPTTVLDLMHLGFLLVLAIGQAELSLGVERVRRTMADTTHINMTSVWTFAGVLLLPPGLAALLAVVVYLHLWFRIWRDMTKRPAYRVVYCTAAAVVACFAGSAVLALFDLPRTWSGATPSMLAWTTAAVAFTATNAAVIAISVHLHTSSRSIAELIGGWNENALELATICLGGLTAVAILAEPWLALFVLLPTIVLHRSVLVQQLEIVANSDPKTGLLNAAGWRDRCESVLSRAARTGTEAAVLMIDLDHFKRVNDLFGHVAGDEVLKQVAITIETHVRDYDVVGRFGGEEFVVLLPSATRDEALMIAERVRYAVTQLQVVIDDDAPLIDGLSTSIGVATFPENPAHRLIETADAACYAAKREGRNRVSIQLGHT